MSKLEPQECRNGCGKYIYFDRNSEVCHPSEDKWYPLEYNKKAGIKTNERHKCPNKGKPASVTSTSKLETSETIIQLLKDIDGKLDRLLAIDGGQ
jgi:hypothetical protein